MHGTVMSPSHMLQSSICSIQLCVQASPFCHSWIFPVVSLDWHLRLLYQHCHTSINGLFQNIFCLCQFHGIFSNGLTKCVGFLPKILLNFFAHFVNQLLVVSL